MDQEPSPYLPIARVAHETQRTVLAALGNNETPVWDALAPELQKSAVTLAEGYIASPNITPIMTIGPTVYAMQTAERAGAYAFYGAVRAIAQEQSRP